MKALTINLSESFDQETKKNPQNYPMKNLDKDDLFFRPTSDKQQQQPPAKYVNNKIYSPFLFIWFVLKIILNNLRTLKFDEKKIHETSTSLFQFVSVTSHIGNIYSEPK